MYTLTSPVRSRAITKSPSMLQPHVLYVKTLFCQAAALTRVPSAAWGMSAAFLSDTRESVPSPITPRIKSTNAYPPNR